MFFEKNNVKFKNVFFYLLDKILVYYWGYFWWGLFDEYGDKEFFVMVLINNLWFYFFEGIFKFNMYVIYILR